MNHFLKRWAGFSPFGHESLVSVLCGQKVRPTFLEKSDVDLSGTPYHTFSLSAVRPLNKNSYVRNIGNWEARKSLSLPFVLHPSLTLSLNETPTQLHEKQFCLLFHLFSLGLAMSLSQNSNNLCVEILQLRVFPIYNVRRAHSLIWRILKGNAADCAVSL